MTLWIGLQLHSISLDIWRLRWLTEPVAAVFERDTLIAATPRALQCGITLGMRRATVRSLVPECALYLRDEAAEQAAYAQAAQVALVYSPTVYQQAHYTLVIEVTYSLRLFGGIRAILHRLKKEFRGLQLQMRCSVAPSALGAWLLVQTAQHAARYACSMPTLERLLNRLPCATLPSARPHLQWLKAIGCETLGGVRALPRSGLQRRIGTELLCALDQAYTPTPLAIAPYIAPEQFVQQLDLLDRIEHTAMLAAMAERLALSLCTWLLAKQCALRSASLALHYERGRHACAPTQLELAFSEPVWLVTQLMPLLRERLSRQPLSGPVVALTLRSQTVVQQHARSATLFPDPLHAPTDFRRLLDLLSARLGAEHVMQPAALADHRPEIANRWAPLHTSASSTLSSQPALSPKRSKYAVAAPSISSLPSTPSTPAITSTSNSVSTLNPIPQTHTEMPFWLLSKPLALKVQANRPHYGTPLHLLQGPERIESGWWDGLRIARDYFVAQDKNAVRYWIYRERDIDHARWFLHGFFG